jgi:hypothetical protein
VAAVLLQSKAILRCEPVRRNAFRGGFYRSADVVMKSGCCRDLLAIRYRRSLESLSIGTLRTAVARSVRRFATNLELVVYCGGTRIVQ